MSGAAKLDRSPLTPWAREFACGCREVVPEGVSVGGGDRCAHHGERIVCGGHLTREETVEVLLTALREAGAALEFAVSTIKAKAPEADWEDSSPRKGLRAVRAAIEKAEATP